MRNLVSLIAVFFPLLLSAQVGVTFLRTDVSCFGNCDGTATAVGLNGTFPYTFVWSTGSTNASVSNLCAGSYTVTVTDATQSTGVGTVVIVQPNQLSVEVHPQDQICGIAPDGVATAVPTGGTAPYSYLWSNDSTGIEILGLEEGVYTVTITDFNGCTAVNQSFVFFQNEGIWLTDSVAHIKCFGDDNGFGHVGPMTGTPPYQYTWSNGPTTQDILNLPPGIYTVTVTDVNGCSNSTSVTVLEPPPLDALIDSLAAICTQPGSATLTPSGGTPGYTVLWSNGDSTFTTTPPAGPISVTLTDANGCEFDLDLSIPDSTIALNVSTNTLGNALCLLGGSASAAATGGSGNFEYDWSNGDSTAVANNLPAGTYTVTITEMPTGCTGTAIASIIAMPSTLSVTASMDSPASCLIGGSASAVATGGLPPYIYIWNNTDTTASVSNLGLGAQVVVVIDSAGCTASDTIQITAAPLPDVQAQVQSEVTCVQGGSATAIATSGFPPYTYGWSNGDSTATANNLQAGTYIVTATDAGGCTATDTIQLVAPQLPEVQAQVQSEVTCTSGGSATATASAGMGPYTYAWSNGDSTATANNLQVGTYTVTATDAGGCTATNTVQLIGLQVPSVQTQLLSAVTCANGGSATAIASGGIAPYTYVWSNGDTTAIATNLQGSTYTVTATDAGGCTATTTIQLAVPQLPDVQTQIQTEVTCANGGSAMASASDGTVPYTFVWSNGDTTATATNLQAGVYTVTVTDAGGCTATATVSLAPPQQPTVAVSAVIDATCTTPGSATASASGGTPPYTYFWDNGDTTATSNNLSAGQHTVIATDAGGCSASVMVSIQQPPLPTTQAQMDNPANCLGNGGSATASASGGTGPYTFLWSNGDTTTTATNLGGGQHTVTATDANGCKAVAIVTIEQEPGPSLSLAITANATCITPGTIQANPSGGSTPYAYLWSNGQSTMSISGPPDTYTLTLTDAIGCTASSTATINGPAMPTVDIIASNDASCAGPGSATASASGGVPPYTYLWDNGETTAQAVNLAPGTHSVTLTDTGGCMATDTVFINNSDTTGTTIGDFVWFDNDMDGFQHPLEKGAPNISVKLLQAGPDSLFNTPDDITVATTQTDSAGKYKFECISPGRYQVVYGNLPAGHEFTGKDKVNNDCKDSDANSQGKTDPFIIQANQGENLCIDAGIHIICDNVTYPGIICCDQTICEGEVPDLIYPVVPATGGSGPFEYVWMQFVQVGPAQPTWVGIPGANNPDYQPGPLFETAYFMRCVRRQGCVTFMESNIVTITVEPAGSPGCPSFFSNFSVQAYSPTTVQLKWTTEAEMTGYLYVVERSYDKHDWQQLTAIKSFNNGAASNLYQTMDMSPANGMNYYRVKRISQSGQESATETRQIQMEMTEASSLAIYPNPVSQLLYIRNLMPYDADTKVQIFTANGQLLHALKIPAGELQSFEIPVAELPQGLYIARIRFGNGEVKTVKIAKM